MSKYYALTPEEYLKRKQRNKIFLYVSLFVGTIVISAAMTFLLNKM